MILGGDYGFRLMVWVRKYVANVSCSQAGIYSAAETASAADVDEKGRQGISVRVLSPDLTSSRVFLLSMLF